MPLIVGPLPTVIYPKPREQPAPQPQPSVEQQESRRFWAAQGYPQYGGRYKAIDLQGRQIESIAETPEGLTISFKVQEQPVLPRTRGIQGAMQSIFERRGSYLAVVSELPTEAQTQLPSQELVRVQYPELKGNEPERFMSENVRAWTEAGFPEYGKVYRFPFGTGIPEGWRTKSVVLAPYGKGNELIWTIEQFATYTLTPEAEAQQTASKEFYAKIGFPQFGGQYAPFEVPSGFKVASVKETYAFPLGGGALESKLAVSFEPIGVPTSPTEIASTPKPPTSYIGRWNELKDFGQDIANVKANAGTSSLTAIIEQYATGLYSKDIVTRTMQKTGFLPSRASNLLKVAGAVSAVESYINPNVPSLFELGSKSPEFIIGRLTGEAMLMAFGGEAFSWMVKGTPNPLKVKATSWLSGSYEEATKAGELWKPSISERIVMKVTGAKPQLSYGEVSIPVVETVSKSGMVSVVPSGLPFTDIGWEMSMAPRMGGVMVTKWPTVTTPRALELFFGIGEELIPFGTIKGEGEPLGFQKPKAEPVTIERGLPPSMLEESYYPKVGGFDVSLKDVNVREIASWPTTRSLMEEQKLLPFVTQTQVTRMGIFPYVPDLAVGATSKSFGSAFLVGLGASLLPKPFPQTRQDQKATLPSLPKLEPLIKLKQPTFEEPFEIQKLKLGPSLIPAQKEKQRTVPLVTVGLGLESLTEAVSVQSSALGTEQIQEPLQVQSLAQIQKQMQKQVQSLASQFKTPSLQKQATTFHLPTEASLKRKGKKRAGKKQAQGLYWWEFPILDPEKVWKLK